MNQSPYYVKKLKEELGARQRRNRSYSLRAFAKDLGVHNSTLSMVFNGKRPLPFKRAHAAARALNLSPEERTLFFESFYKSKTRLGEIPLEEAETKFLADKSYFKIIAEWEYGAALDLFDIKGAKFCAEFISKKLGVSAARAETVLEGLIEAKLIKKKGGEFERAYPKLRTAEDVKNDALKASHLETLELGKNKLEEIEVELRDFSSMTSAIDLKKLPEAKAIIREFRQKMAALLRDGDQTDVYQLAIQFYPMTEINKENTK